MIRLERCWFLLLTVLLAALAASDARADVKRTGEWPSGEMVSLSVSGVTRAEAVRELGETLGWSLVVEDLGDETIDVTVKEQPAGLVVELVLSRGNFVADRRGNLVAIRAEAPSSPDAAAAQTSSSTGVTTAKHGEDLFVTDRGRVGPGEVVRDVFVWGGSVVIEGTVTRSVAVFGGDVTFGEGAHVHGDVVAFGGSLDLENGAEVDGEVSALFGTLHRGDQVQVECPTCDDPPKDPFAQFFRDFFERLTGAALFWIFGAIVIATSLPRVELVRGELVRRPLRALGAGVLGFLALLMVLATLAVTLIGIPLALLAALVAAISVYVGFCVVLLTAGGLLVGGRSQNPYVHLGLGCAAYFLLQWVPVVGVIACVASLLLALGGLVLSRGAGLFRRRASTA